MKIAMMVYGRENVVQEAASTVPIVPICTLYPLGTWIQLRARLGFPSRTNECCRLWSYHSIARESPMLNPPVGPIASSRPKVYKVDDSATEFTQGLLPQNTCEISPLALSSATTVNHVPCPATAKSPRLRSSICLHQCETGLSTCLKLEHGFAEQKEGTHTELRTCCMLHGNDLSADSMYR